MTVQNKIKRLHGKRKYAPSEMAEICAKRVSEMDACRLFELLTEQNDRFEAVQRKLQNGGTTVVGGDGLEFSLELMRSLRTMPVMWMVFWYCRLEIETREVSAAEALVTTIINHSRVIKDRTNMESGCIGRG